jgi:hypothetical protein
VAALSEAVAEYSRMGFRVLIETTAGKGAYRSDEEYADAGCHQRKNSTPHRISSLSRRMRGAMLCATWTADRIFGVDTPLYRDPSVRLLFGDARSNLERLAGRLVEWEPDC